MASENYGWTVETIDFFFFSPSGEKKNWSPSNIWVLKHFIFFVEQEI